MFNVSPIGRNCSRAERNDYEKFDLEHNIRKNMVEAMKKEFADLDLSFSIGGQISFDVFPKGWDKTYCLRFLSSDDFDEIHFFGDKTFEGGNDYGKCFIRKLRMLIVSYTFVLTASSSCEPFLSSRNLYS